MHPGSRPSVARALACALAAFALAFAAWSCAIVVAGLLGLHLATSTSNPPPPAALIVSQQMRDVVMPFLPAAFISAVVLSLFLTSGARQLVSVLLVGTALAPASFIASVVILAAFAERGQPGGYAAEHGMEALIYVIAAILGLSAVPFWLGAAGLAARLSRPRQRTARSGSASDHR